VANPEASLVSIESKIQYHHYGVVAFVRHLTLRYRPPPKTLERGRVRRTERHLKAAVILDDEPIWSVTLVP
jgi:hypothetical protein